MEQINQNKMIHYPCGWKSRSKKANEEEFIQGAEMIREGKSFYSVHKKLGIRTESMKIWLKHHQENPRYCKISTADVPATADDQIYSDFHRIENSIQAAEETLNNLRREKREAVLQRLAKVERQVYELQEEKIELCDEIKKLCELLGEDSNVNFFGEKKNTAA